jgi:hypothetical protein
MIIKIKIIILSIFTFSTIANSSSLSNEQLSTFLVSSEKSQIDISNSANINNLTLEHQDLKIHLIDGKLLFFQPVLLDTVSLTYAAYFEGTGSLQFNPANGMEKEQLKRYTKSDILKRPFNSMVLLFSPDFYQQYFKDVNLTSVVIGKESIALSKSMLETLTDDSQNLYLFELLRSTQNPIGRPFLTTLINTDFSESFIYMYNPYSSEEVKLLKNFPENESILLGEINSYSQYNLDESYRSINGRNKDQLNITHYDIDALVNQKQDLHCIVKLKAKILSGPTQMVLFNLGESIIIDSLFDENQKKVKAYDKIKKTKNEFDKTRKFGIILNRSYSYNDTLNLTFYLSGKIDEENSTETIIYAGTNWYPRYRNSERSIYNMTIRSDAGNHIVGTGNRLERKNAKDTLITKWRVIPASSSATFLISDLLKYRIEDQDEFQEEKLNPLDIYYSRKIHQKIADYHSADKVGLEDSIQWQVAEDIMNAIRVYKYYYNSTPKNILAVTETKYKRGESIPGLAMLGFDTWIKTDPFGNDGMYRSREIARQWWGVDVDYETYHDKWITDGLSLYSSLLYIQRVMKNKILIEKIQEFRDAIYSAKYYITGIDAEVGPVALGRRTSYLGNSQKHDSAIQKKSALIFHMLRNLMINFTTMNDEKFTAMLREFYQRYRGKNVSTAQFQQIVEKYTGIKMDWFFKQWVYGTEIPEYEFSYTIELIPTEGYKISGHVITKNVSDDFKMYVPLQIEFENGNKAVVRLLIDSKDYNFSLPNLPNSPKKLLFNPLESVLARVKQ